MCRIAPRTGGHGLGERVVAAERGFHRVLVDGVGVAQEDLVALLLEFRYRQLLLAQMRELGIHPQVIRLGVDHGTRVGRAGRVALIPGGVAPEVAELFGDLAKLLGILRGHLRHNGGDALFAQVILGLAQVFR